MKKNQYKQQAKSILKGHWIKAMLITLISLVLVVISTLLIDIIASIFHNNIVTCILLLLDVFVILPILHGATISILNLITGQSVNYTDPLILGFTNIKKVWKVGGFLFIETLPVLLLFFISFTLFIWAILQNIVLYFGYHAYVTAFLIILLISFILSITFFYLLIKRWLLFPISSFIIHDEPNLKMMDVVTKTKLFFKQNKRKFIQLNFSFTILFLLSIITLGIGLIFWIPYMKATFYLFYKDMNTNKK